MRYCTDKDVDRLLRLIERNGGAVRISNGGHVRVSAPGISPVFIPASPSSRYALQLARRTMRPVLEALHINP